MFDVYNEIHHNTHPNKCLASSSDQYALAQHAKPRQLRLIPAIQPNPRYPSQLPAIQANPGKTRQPCHSRESANLDEAINNVP